MSKDTIVSSAIRMAYRLGRLDQQRILRRKMREYLDPKRAKQLGRLAAGRMDELSDLTGIIRAAESSAAAPAEALRDFAQLLHESEERGRGRALSLAAIRAHDHHTRYSAEIRDAIGGVRLALGERRRSDAEEIREMKAALRRAQYTVAEYEGILSTHGYNGTSINRTDWLRARLTERAQWLRLLERAKDWWGNDATGRLVRNDIYALFGVPTDHLHDPDRCPGITCEGECIGIGPKAKTNGE